MTNRPMHQIVSILISFTIALAAVGAIFYHLVTRN